MPWKKGIVRKTFVFSAFLITLVTLISFTILYFAMPGYYRYQKAKTFQANLDVLTASLKNAASQEESAEIISEFSQGNNANVMSFDADGVMLPTISTPYVSMQGEGDAFFTVTQEGGGTNYSLFLSRRVRDGDEAGPVIAMRSLISRSGDSISLRGEVGNPVIDHVVVSSTLQPVDEAKDVILSLIPYVLAAGIVLGLALSWVYARQLSKPILRISDATERMQRMEPDAYSDIRSDDELGLLSENLDALYTSLRENIETLKGEMDKANRLERSKTEMMQSASHELKTPIAALGGMLEGMLDNVGVYRDREKYLAECRGQVEKLATLVGEILDASKSDGTEEYLEIAEIRLDELVRRALSEYSVQIRENGLNVIAELEPVVIETDEAVMYRVISNIMSNAARYSDGHGEIRVRVCESGGDRRLTVENQCPPIPDAEIAKLFEPFYTRSYSRDKAKSGTGLGLYLVKRSLERLGISYTAENGELGLKISLLI